MSKGLHETESILWDLYTRNINFTFFKPCSVFIDQLIDLFCNKQCMFGLLINEFMDNLFFRPWTIEAFSVFLSKVREWEKKVDYMINLQPVFKLLNVHPPLRLEGKMSKLGGKKEVATVVTLPKVTSVKAALDDHSNTESVSDL